MSSFGRLIRSPSAAVCFVLLVWACGSEAPAIDPASEHDTSTDAGPPEASSQLDPDSATDASCTPAGTPCGENQFCSPDGQCIACTEGEACDTDDVCAVGTRSCAGGVPTCVKSDLAPDGTSCATGHCTRGTCSEDVSITTDTNLSIDALTSDRTCAEAISYSVTELTATTATLATEPDESCLTPGDEVLVINLQGSATSTVNVGVFETLYVQAVTGSTVTFAQAKTKSFGEGDADDMNIGTDVGQQKVMLARVPRFGKLTIDENVTVTATAWDGLKGGVIALRAGDVLVDGTIDAHALGYRGGRWSRDDETCSDNVHTEAGESIAGSGTATTDANGGGSGGISVGVANFNSNNPLGASAGHATAGQDGANGLDRTLGEPGEVYGIADGTKLTMGSGGGGNLTCQVAVEGPVLVDNRPHAGGIVAVFGGNITVSASGSINATPEKSRTAASGGYVLLRGDVVDFSSGKVTAEGGPGDNGQDVTNVGGDGYVSVHYKTSVSGTSTPAATSQQTNTP